MKLRSIHLQPVVTIASALVLVIVVVYVLYTQSPTSFKSLLSQARPGVIEINVEPDAIVNKPFKVVINVDSQQQAINAVGVYLRFDAKVLQLSDMDTTQSFCQFYPEKKFDNQVGLISLVCGAPHPGITAKNALLQLEFLPLNSGVTTLLVDPRSQILLSDGKGTNILPKGEAINKQIVVRSSL